MLTMWGMLLNGCQANCRHFFSGVLLRLPTCTCAVGYEVAQLQPTDSFIHLHAVVDLPADRFPPDQLPVHSYFLSRELLRDTGWPTLTISTAIDSSLAPPSKQVSHQQHRLNHDSTTHMEHMPRRQGSFPGAAL
jgi:hypothetical protein